MSFCPKCGQPIADGAKFCANCGNAVDKSNLTNQRKTTYDGEIHKCPHCGETLRAFETVCPACGTELRGTRSSNAINSLAEKLENATSEKQRIIIIKNFPIPNTREDIFEFMLLASSNFDSSYYAAHLQEENISGAWLAKIEQCYSKAKLSFGDHPDFRQIESIYMGIKADCADKASKIRSEERAKAFKKSILRTLIIVFAVISALFAAVSFDNGEILSGVIAVAMFALFVVAFLMGSGVIKERVRNMRLLPLILAFALFIPYFSTDTSEPTEDGSLIWDDILLNEYAPKPFLTSATVMTNSNEEFYIYNIECSQSDYYEYVDACKEFGYDYEIIEEDEHSFEAYNEEGYQIRVSYITTLTVEVNVPMKMALIEWPNSDIAELIPQPKSLYGKIEWEHDDGFAIYIGNTSLTDYKEYVSLIYNSGFTIDYSKSDTYFWADNADGYHVSVEYEGFNIVFICIDGPEKA